MGDGEGTPQTGGRLMGVTTQEYWATVVAVLAIGCLVGWALFGKPEGVKAVAQTGSIAEIFAAVGTWVIGVGAWKIARDNHIRQEEERLAQKTALLSGIEEKARRLSYLQTLLNSFMQSAPESRTPGILCSVLEMNEEMFKHLAWTNEERCTVNADCIHLMHCIDLDLIMFRNAAVNLLGSAKQDSGSIGVVTESWLAHAIQRADDLALHCQALRTHVLVLHQAQSS